MHLLSTVFFLSSFVLPSLCGVINSNAFSRHGPPRQVNQVVDRIKRNQFKPRRPSSIPDRTLRAKRSGGSCDCSKDRLCQGAGQTCSDCRCTTCADGMYSKDHLSCSPCGENREKSSGGSCGDCKSGYESDDDTGNCYQISEACSSKSRYTLDGGKCGTCYPNWFQVDDTSYCCTAGYIATYDDKGEYIACDHEFNQGIYVDSCGDNRKAPSRGYCGACLPGYESSDSTSTCYKPTQACSSQSRYTLDEGKCGTCYPNFNQVDDTSYCCPNGNIANYNQDGTYFGCDWEFNQGMYVDSCGDNRKAPSRGYCGDCLSGYESSDSTSTCTQIINEECEAGNRKTLPGGECGGCKTEFPTDDDTPPCL